MIYRIAFVRPWQGPLTQSGLDSVIFKGRSSFRLGQGIFIPNESLWKQRHGSMFRVLSCSSRTFARDLTSVPADGKIRYWDGVKQQGTGKRSLAGFWRKALVFKQHWPIAIQFSGHWRVANCLSCLWHGSPFLTLSSERPGSQTPKPHPRKHSYSVSRQSVTSSHLY